MRTVFIGDSHLARLRRGLRGFAGEIHNGAEGGATSRDLLRQAEAVGAHVVRTDLLLEEFGVTAFADDGLHLNGTGYRVVVPAIQTACDVLR